MFGVNDDEVRVMKVSAISRVAVLVLQWLANELVPDHQSPDAYRNELDTKHVQSGADWRIHRALQGLNRWDSQYFIAIAYGGYSQEELLAFFPMFPLLVRHVANILWTIQQIFTDRTVISYYCLILLSSFVVNFVLFVLTALVLYKLTVRLFGNRAMAERVVTWFSYNPSSIFFSSSYSESLYAFLTYSAIYLTYKTQTTGHMLVASAVFGLSSATRSNGIISIGFILYKQFNHLLNECFVEKGQFVLKRRWMSRLLMIALQTLVYIFICLLPFIGYQWYSYRLYCTGSDRPKVWCLSTLPLSYSHVQSQYWDVGFLRYYQFRQIPNFMLALPVIVFNLKTCLTYLFRHKNRFIAIISQSPNSSVQRLKSYDSILQNDMCFVHIVHTLCLTIFCVLFVHIQVTTRMLMSSTPLVYWAAESAEVKRHKRQKDLIYYWFYGYFIIGTILHSNHLPFT